MIFLGLVLVLALSAPAHAQSPSAVPSPSPSASAGPASAPSAPFPSPSPSARPPASPAASPSVAASAAAVQAPPSPDPDVIKGDDTGDEDDAGPVKVRPEVLAGQEPAASPSAANPEMRLPAPTLLPGNRPTSPEPAATDDAIPRPRSITRTEPGARPARAPATARPNENYIRDDAQVFPAAVTAQLTRTIQSLEGKADIFIVTKVIEDMALFDQASQAAFKEIVDEVNHYRVVVVFIAYNAERDRGIVSTNLGYGVWHILTKKDCENLFGKDDAALTVEGIKGGVEKLVAHIAEYHKAHPDSATAPAFTGFDNLMRNLPRLLVVGVVLLGLLWFWRRGSNCPKCGAPLKTRVSISMVTRTGRMAKKTYKCFRCGYTRRQSLIPSGGYGDAPGRMPAAEEEIVEAGLDDEHEPDHAEHVEEPPGA